MTEFYNCLIFCNFHRIVYNSFNTTGLRPRKDIFHERTVIYHPFKRCRKCTGRMPFLLYPPQYWTGSSGFRVRLRFLLYGSGHPRTNRQSRLLPVSFQKMFDYGNTLGNAWILKTHYQRMIREMQQEFASFRPGKSSLLGKFKKPKAMKIPSACGFVQKRIPAISVPSIKIPTPDIWTPFLPVENDETSAIKS